MSKLWTLHLTEAEAWAIDDLIRHTWTEEGRPVGKGLLLKVFTLLKEFEARRGQPGGVTELPLALAEDECWAIEYHIRRDYVDSSGAKIGRTLLPKLFDLILSMRNDEAVRPLATAPEPELTSEDDANKRRRLEEWRERLGRDEDEAAGPPDA